MIARAPKNALISVVLGIYFLMGVGFAQERSTLPPSTAGAASGGGESADVEALKKQYWAQGDETKLGVVQDRYYTKAGRMEVGVFGGIFSGDPFLDTKSLGGILSYHISEYFALQAVGRNDFVNDSSAYDAFVRKAGVRTNSNATKNFFGLEGALSPLYGKLSLFGDIILYVDVHVLAGLGSTQTENGNYLTPSLGIGQQLFISRSVALGVDIRWMGYREDIVERVNTANLGKTIDSQTVYSSLATLGLYFYL